MWEMLIAMSLSLHLKVQDKTVIGISQPIQVSAVVL